MDKFQQLLHELIMRMNRDYAERLEKENSLKAKIPVPISAEHKKILDELDRIKSQWRPL